MKNSQQTDREEMMEVEEMSSDGVEVSKGDLVAANQKLRAQLAELSRANSDLQNLMAAMDTGAIFLDRDLRIKRYTPRMAGLFNLAGSDVGRPFAPIAHQLSYDRFTDDAERVLTGLAPLERELSSRQGRWYIVRLLPYRTPDNQIDGLVITFVDVTERKEAEQARRESEWRLAALYESSVVPISFWHTDGRVLEANDAYLDLVGYTRQEMEAGALRWDTLTPSEWKEQDRRVLEEIERTGVGFQAMEKEYQRRDGTRAPILLAGGLLPGWKDQGISVVLDLTPHKKAEAAVRRSEEQARRRLLELEAIYDTAPVGLCVFDTDLRYVRINERLAEINGASADEHLGRTVREMVPDLADDVEPLFRQILETGEPLLNQEVRGETAAQPGVERTWIEHWYPIKDDDGKPVGINVVAEEITERKRAEDALRESKARFRTLFDNTLEAIFLADDTGTYIDLNPAACKLLGYAREDLIGRTISDLSVSSDGVVETWATFLKEGTMTGEYQLRHKEGHIIDVAFKAIANVLPGMHLSTVRDEMERKRAEAQLREAKERFQTVTEMVPDIIFTTDTDIRIEYLNQRWTALTGASVEESLGDNWQTFLHPADINAALAKWEQAKATGERFEDRQRLRTKDGTYCWIMVRARPIRDEAGRIIRWFGTGTEIDSLVQAEQEIQFLNENLELRVEERTRQVRALTSALTMAEQQERRRIAQILHDDLQQLLYALDIAVKQLRSDTLSQREQATLDRADRILNKAIATTRSLTVELSPPVLEGDGLETTLEWLGVHMEDVYKLHVTVEAPKPVHIPSKDLRVLLFHLVRELLFNVVKHAAVNRALIKTFVTDEHVVIQVIDQGAGFDPRSVTQAASTDGGFGLPSLQERLHLVGGGLDIESAPGEGACITIRAPLGAPGMAPG